MIRAGVVGYGYWGPNLVRNLADSDGIEIAAVCDSRPQRLALAQKRYPYIRTYEDWRDLVADPSLDLVAVSTPVCTHFEIGRAALRAGKHLLVEKPMAMNVEECEQLIEDAASRRLVLMVDHTFIYTPAVKKMRELVVDGSLGEIYYYDSVRVNLGLFQHDINVIWDLAVHDLAIMDFVLPERPVAVSATGISHLPSGPENIGYLTMFFNSNRIAHIHVNWLAPVKVRTTMLGGSKKMLVYNDVEPSEKIKVYDRGITVNSNPENLYKMMIEYRAGDVWVPHLANSEALAAEVRHLADCIEHGKEPITGGDTGMEVVRILECGTRSMRGQGLPVELSDHRSVAI